MTWNPLNWFRWLFGLFASDRAKIIREYLKEFAIPVAEDLMNRDFNGDGKIGNIRDELARLFAVLPDEITRRVFPEYIDDDGTILSSVIGGLPVKSLKGVLAMALVALRLVRSDRWVPSYGLLETIAQLAYEAVQKKRKAGA